MELLHAPVRHTHLAAGRVKDTSMTRVYLADGQVSERSALRLMLQDLKMSVVGEAADWAAVLAEAPAAHPDMLLVDFSLLPGEPASALVKVRLACPNALVMLLHSQVDARQQAALSAGADGLICKCESPERVAGHLRSAARRVRADKRALERS